MIGQPKVYSSYLVQPRIRPDHGRWKGFRTQYYVVKRSNPHLLRNTLGIMVVWVSVIASVQSLTVSSPTAAQLASVPTVDSPVVAAPDPSAPVASTAQTPAPAVQVASAAAPAAPPPAPVVQTAVATSTGAIAPFGTYRNNYAYGQCTWYVASRRPTPTNWGNANTWYYRAAAAGRRVGSIPAVGAIAWTSAGRYGHVALVERVSADGRQVTISEMNYNGNWNRITTRTVPASYFRYIY